MYPSHTYVHVDGLVDYYERLAGATDLPLVLYKRGDEADREVLDALSKHDDYVACKWAVDDVEGFASTAAYVDGDLVWLDGIAERFAPAFALEGAEGITTGIGNFVPELSLELMDAIREADWEQARELRELARRFQEIRGQVEGSTSVGVVKHGMDIAGYYGGPVRPPLKPMAEQYREQVEDAYDDLTDELEVAAD
ncbi:MAG: dihydrodipicolinate synthase family protein, partial [Halobacteriaceae archaeon]